MSETGTLSPAACASERPRSDGIDWVEVVTAKGALVKARPLAKRPWLYARAFKIAGDDGVSKEVLRWFRLRTLGGWPTVVECHKTGLERLDDDRIEPHRLTRFHVATTRSPFIQLAEATEFPGVFVALVGGKPAFFRVAVGDVGRAPSVRNVTLAILGLRARRMAEGRARDGQNATARKKLLARVVWEEQRSKNATPQTRRNLKQDPIKRLLFAEKIGDDEVRAWVEIGDVLHALCGSLQARSADPSGSGVRGSVSDGMPKRLAIAYTKRYAPWARRLERANLQGSIGPALPVALGVLIEGRSCRDMETEFRLRHGQGGRLLAIALISYAVWAGWRRPAKPRVGCAAVVGRPALCPVCGDLPACATDTWWPEVP